jgi:hypothetical protein
MKPRNFLSFFKTKSGKLILFGTLFAGVLMLLSVFRQRHSPSEGPETITPLATNSVSGKPEVVQTIVRPMQPFYPPPLQSQPMSSTSSAVRESSSQGWPAVTNSSPQPLPVAPLRQLPPLTPISLLADTTAGRPKPKTLSADYAPFGRLIPCETVVTVDSSSMETPIIALVTENIYFGGRLIIPAGTEVHGMAQTDRQRDRIATSASWTFVWQDGQEMQLKAIALDREFDNNTNQSGWAITDGSAGLRGEILKSDNMADIKLFAATFLSGAASALTEKQETIFGPINSPTLNNAPFQGAQAVLQTYAQQIYDSIQKNGFYVRVPSGKQFYLYVLQTIDRADATFGGVSMAGNVQPAATQP